MQEYIKSITAAHKYLKDFTDTVEKKSMQGISSFLLMKLKEKRHKETAAAAEVIETAASTARSLKARRGPGKFCKSHIDPHEVSSGQKKKLEKEEKAREEKEKKEKENAAAEG